MEFTEEIMSYPSPDLQVINKYGFRLLERFKDKNGQC